MAAKKKTTKAARVAADPEAVARAMCQWVRQTLAVLDDVASNLYRIQKAIEKDEDHPLREYWTPHDLHRSYEEVAEAAGEISFALQIPTRFDLTPDRRLPDLLELVE